MQEVLRSCLLHFEWTRIKKRKKRKKQQQNQEKLNKPQPKMNETKEEEAHFDIMSSLSFCFQFKVMDRPRQ